MACSTLELFAVQALSILGFIRSFYVQPFTFSLWRSVVRHCIASSVLCRTRSFVIKVGEEIRAIDLPQIPTAFNNNKKVKSLKAD